MLYFCVDFLFEAWRPLVGDKSFLFAQGVDTFKRREHLDFKVTASCKERYAKTFRSVSQFRFKFSVVNILALYLTDF